MGSNLQVSNSIKQSGSWFILSLDTNGVKTYYDPYQTSRDGPSNIETLIWNHSPDGSQSGVDRIKFDCDKRMYQRYRATLNGTWEMYADWKSVTPTLTDEIWLKNLCPFRNSQQEQFEFIGMLPNSAQINAFNTWYLIPNSEKVQSSNGQKVFKLYHFNGVSRKMHYVYTQVDCGSRRIADATQTMSDKSYKLTWYDEPAKDSPFGYVLNKTCGFNKTSSKPKADSSSQSQPSKPILDDSLSLSLGDAKKKCQSLGFKVGSEQFGKCVLKLSQ